MAADAWVIYDKYPLRLGDGGIDSDADVFKQALVTSASNFATLSTEGFGAITGEVTGNGYVQHTHGSVTYTEATGTITFDADDATYTAAGGSIVCRAAVIYDDTVVTPTADVNVCHSILDGTPADTTVTDGNTLTVQNNASGIYTLS
jgi:hypothetical protein